MDYYNIWLFVVYLCDMKHFVKSVSSLMPLRLVMMAMLAVACGPVETIIAFYQHFAEI